MNALDVKKVLLENDVEYLYHVNTVVTSLSYMNNGGLFSRGAATNLSLPQTAQTSDDTDIELGVFFDVFFDSCDIHSRAKRINDYGPVTFVFGIDVLDDYKNYDIKITKSNPIYWTNDMSEEEKYFCSVEDLKENFRYGNFAQEITICCIEEAVNFKNLIKIIIENPKIENTKYFDNACKSINDALLHNHIDIPFIVRECSNNCTCKERYNSVKEGYVYHRFKTRL